MFLFVDAYNIFVEIFVSRTADDIQFSMVRGSCYLKPRQPSNSVDILFPIPAVDEGLDDVRIVPIDSHAICQVFQGCHNAFPSRIDQKSIDYIGAEIFPEITVFASFEDFLVERKYDLNYVKERQVSSELNNGYVILSVSASNPPNFLGEEFTFCFAFVHSMIDGCLYIPSARSLKSGVNYTVFSVNTSSNGCGKSIEEEVRAMAKKYYLKDIQISTDLPQILEQFITPHVKLDHLLELRRKIVVEEDDAGFFSFHGSDQSVLSGGKAILESRKI